MSGNDRLTCSFCGKTQDQVKKLIAGPNAFICNECVELCNEILDEEFFEGKDKKSDSIENGENGEAKARRPRRGAEGEGDDKPRRPRKSAVKKN